jgi:hypothetical protein
MSAAKRPTRRDAPAGLVSMFTLLGDPGADGSANQIEATQIYPLAQRLIDDLRAGDSRAAALALAMNAVYGDVDASDLDMSHGLEAGFRVGIAAAWMVLRDLNGNAR